MLPENGATSHIHTHTRVSLRSADMSSERAEGLSSLALASA